MNKLMTDTRKFWCAAYFLRLAPHRDRTHAILVLEDLTRTATGHAKDRAQDLLGQFNGKQSNRSED